jgi:hypothetical protein
MGQRNFTGSDRGGKSGAKKRVARQTNAPQSQPEPQPQPQPAAAEQKQRRIKP